MLIRQFSFKPKREDLLDKDLYQSVIKKDDYTVLTLKENIKIGYAESFQQAIDYVHEMSIHFIDNTITEVNLFNGLTLLKGRGKSSVETIMDLTCSYFNYAFFDMNMVTIEMKGVLKPVTKNEGQFNSLFYEELIEESGVKTVELFCSIKGDALTPLSMDANGFSSYEDNIITSVVVGKNDNAYSLKLRYLGIKADTGELYENVIFNNEHFTGSLPDSYSNYLPVIKKAKQILDS